MEAATAAAARPVPMRRARRRRRAPFAANRGAWLGSGLSIARLPRVGSGRLQYGRGGGTDATVRRSLAGGPRTPAAAPTLLASRATRRYVGGGRCGRRRTRHDRAADP